MDLNFEDDILYVDGWGDYTLQVSGDDDFPLQCLEKLVTYKEIEASNGQLKRGDHIFMWQAKIHDLPPLGSVIQDSAGVDWTILTISYTPHVETYEVGCRALSVEAGLDNYATVLQAKVYGKNDSGEAVPIWTTISSNVPARFQPYTEEAAIFEGSDYTKATYRITFGDEPTDNPGELAGNNYRVVDQDGNRYKVTQYINEQRIDRLPVAIAIRVHEGSEFHDA